MHQIRSELEVRPRPRWGSLQRPRRPQLYLRGLTFKEREEEDGEGKGREVKRRGREGRGGGEASLPPPNILA